MTSYGFFAFPSDSPLSLSAAHRISQGIEIHVDAVLRCLLYQFIQRVSFSRAALICA
jgi:hypothetical protein